MLGNMDQQQLLQLLGGGGLGGLGNLGKLLGSSDCHQLLVSDACDVACKKGDYGKLVLKENL